MEKKEAMKILKDFHDKSALFSVRTALDTIIPELCESEDEEKPNGGIVLEDFNEGDGFYKVNLAYLSKEQVEEIENIVKKWNHKPQESEDEKIRKELIDAINGLWDNDALPMPLSVKRKDAWIAWLEKQEGCEHIRKDWLEHIKQSWYKEGFIDGKYSGVKEWTINDDATLKELIDFLENGKAILQHDLTHYANWLKIKFTPKKHLE